MERIPNEAHNLKARDEKAEERKGDHFSNLYDADADEAGEKIDLATGKRIARLNAPVVSGNDEKLRTVKARGKSADALGAIREKNDAAAKWLREHGGDQKAA